MSAFTLRAAWVLTIEQPPLANGYVTVVDDRIAAVGKWSHDAGPATDLGDVVLLPGLVNAHTHLEFSSLTRPLGSPGMSLPAWIRQVIADRKRGDRDAAAAVMAGLRECVAAGVTTIGEIAASPATLYAGAAGPTTLLFQEAIGFSAGRVDSVFAEVEQRLAAAPLPAGVSPHAPYTVHPRLLMRMAELAAARNVPVAMHVAESREELQLLATGDGEFRDLLIERSMWDVEAIPSGSRPLDYLRVIAGAPRSLVVHGNYLALDEIEFIGARSDRMSVVYCPRTHAYFQHAPYPLAAMLHAGVRVVLGTDSRASNPDLSVLHELRAAARAHPSLSPDTLLHMATLDAARALGLADQAGSIAVGKRADLIAMPLSQSTADAPYDAVVNADAPPLQVWLAGTLVTAELQNPQYLH